MGEIMSSGLQKVREELASIKSEASLIYENDIIKDLFNQLQDLKEEMNQAKKKASAEAAKPFLQTIKEIEENYAMWLRLHG